MEMDTRMDDWWLTAELDSVRRKGEKSRAGYHVTRHMSNELWVMFGWILG